MIFFLNRPYPFRYGVICRPSNLWCHANLIDNIDLITFNLFETKTFQECGSSIYDSYYFNYENMFRTYYSKSCYGLCETRLFLYSESFENSKDFEFGLESIIIDVKM